MKWCVWLLAFGLALSAAQTARAAGAAVQRFALVIGNDRPESSSAELLRYADDDALATHSLLSDAHVQSLLFVTLDEATRSMHPKVNVAGAARWSEIERGFTALVARMKQATANGARTEFLLFYSGHGDVDGGEGYVVLEDRRLTRSMLFSLLSRSSATHNHVFIDACKSYFLVFDRGPGGHRSQYLGNWAERVPANLGNSGFVLSTSSDRASHEWERYQGGILSHELRSGLRGAADADLDGAVSYAELGAFLVAANRAIQNPRFKPDFMVRAPGHDLEQQILSYPASAGTLSFAARAWGHFYVENARGERVLDAHPRAGQALRVLAPAERPLFVRQSDELAEYAVEAEGSVEVAALSPTAPQIAQRGAQSLAFQWTFSTPFGQAEVRDFRASAAAERDQPPETSSKPSSSRRTVARIAGITSLTASAAGLTLTALAIETSVHAKAASQASLASSNQRIVNLNRASLVCYGTALAAGLTWAWATWWPESNVTVNTSSSGAELADGLVLNFSRRF